MTNTAAVLEKLPDNERSAFAERHEDKIQDECELVHVLIELPYDQQGTFAERHKDKIQYKYEFSMLIETTSKGLQRTIANHFFKKRKPQSRALIDNSIFGYQDPQDAADNTASSNNSEPSLHALT